MFSGKRRDDVFAVRRHIESTGRRRARKRPSRPKTRLVRAELFFFHGVLRDHDLAVPVSEKEFAPVGRPQRVTALVVRDLSLHPVIRKTANVNYGSAGLD